MLQSNLAKSSEKQSVALNSNAKPTKPVSVVENKDIPKSEVTNSSQDEQVNESDSEGELSSSAFIEELAGMNQLEFQNYLNSSYQNNSQISNELIEELLNALITLTDSQARWRLIEVLNSERSKQAYKQEFGIENWVLNKIQNYEQASEWLGVLSVWGVGQYQSGEYLAESLDTLYSSEQRVSSLLSLSRSFFYHDLENKLIVDQAKAKITAKITPYLDSNNDLERAAAVRAISRFPNENIQDQLIAALEDDAERVRIGAIRAFTGENRLSSNQVKNGLIKLMQSGESSALERFSAWSALQSMPLEGEHYEAVYEFRANSADEIRQKLRAESSRERTQWD